MTAQASESFMFDASLVTMGRRLLEVRLPTENRVAGVGAQIWDP
jgi:hypothetical protein